MVDGKIATHRNRESLPPNAALTTNRAHGASVFTRRQGETNPPGPFSLSRVEHSCGFHLEVKGVEGTRSSPGPDPRDTEGLSCRHWGLLKPVKEQQSTKGDPDEVHDHVEGLAGKLQDAVERFLKTGAPAPNGLKRSVVGTPPVRAGAFTWSRAPTPRSRRSTPNGPTSWIWSFCRSLKMMWPARSRQGSTERSRTDAGCPSPRGIPRRSLTPAWSRRGTDADTPRLRPIVRPQSGS